MSFSARAYASELPTLGSGEGVQRLPPHNENQRLLPGLFEAVPRVRGDRAIEDDTDRGIDRCRPQGFIQYA